MLDTLIAVVSAGAGAGVDVSAAIKEEDDFHFIVSHLCTIGQQLSIVQYALNAQCTECMHNIYQHNLTTIIQV